MNPTTISVLAAALLLAGCIGEPAPGTSQTTTPAAAPSGALGANSTAAGALVLHLQADGSLLEAAPAQAGWVAYPEPVNSPIATQHPLWMGALPRGGNLTSTEIPIVLYLSSSSANAAARLLPPFILEDLPGLFVSVRIGGAEWFVSIPGPEIVHAGQVFEARGVLVYEGTGAPPPLKPGDAIQLEIEAAYVHAKDAAELRFLVGPETAAALSMSL